MDTTADQTTGNQTSVEQNNPESRKPSDTISLKRFPLTLEADGAPYVVFKIYEIGSNGTLNSTAPKPEPDPVGAVVGNAFQFAANTATTIDQNLTAGLAGTAVNAAGNLIGQQLGIQDPVAKAKETLTNLSLRRHTAQLKSAIALMMPDGLSANYEHNYDELSLTGVLGGAGLLAQALTQPNADIDTKNAALIEGLSRSLVGRLPLLQESEELTNVLVFGASGRTINPQLELLYNSPRLRTFTFDFLMVPRSQREAKALDEILYLLRYFAAPELPESSSGRFMIPPAQFEIEFYHKNARNNYLFKTKKCVLESLSYDYSPNGYASFRDGFPVQTRLQLTFKETVIMHKGLIREEKGNNNTIEEDFRIGSFGPSGRF